MRLLFFFSPSVIQLFLCEPGSETLDVRKGWPMSKERDAEQGWDGTTVMIGTVIVISPYLKSGPR